MSNRLKKLARAMIEAKKTETNEIAADNRIWHMFHFPNSELYHEYAPRVGRLSNKQFGMLNEEIRRELRDDWTIWEMDICGENYRRWLLENEWQSSPERIYEYVTEQPFDHGKLECRLAKEHRKKSTHVPLKAPSCITDERIPKLPPAVLKAASEKLQEIVDDYRCGHFEGVTPFGNGWHITMLLRDHVFPEVCLQKMGASPLLRGTTFADLSEQIQTTLKLYAKLEMKTAMSV